MTSGMVRLYLSTSSPTASIGLEANDEFLVLETQQTNKHSDFINQAFANLLAEAQVTPDQVSGVILDHGPGSFTGVRVGISFAKALCYKNNISIWSTHSLNALKTPSDLFNYLYAMNAHRNSIYLLDPVTQNVVLRSVTQFESDLLSLQSPVTLVGDAWETYHEHLSAEVTNNIRTSKHQFPHVENLYQLFLSSPEMFEAHSWQSLIPFYLRLSSAEETLVEKELNTLKEPK